MQNLVFIGCFAIRNVTGNPNWAMFSSGFRFERFGIGKMRIKKCDCGGHEFKEIKVAGEPRIKIRESVKRKAYPEDPLRAVWRAIKSRCYNPASSSYKYYGARGIECRFETFKKLKECLGPRPSREHQVDRIDTDGHYEPGNVRWALPGQNIRNRRNTVEITFMGERKSLAEWSEISGVPYVALQARMRRGWSVDRILKEVDARQMPLCW